MENYFYFLVTALIMAILPGADFAVVTKNTLAARKKGDRLLHLESSSKFSKGYRVNARYIRYQTCIGKKIERLLEALKPHLN